MRKNINIEVEGQELILKNKAGDYVIIPKKYRTKVQGMIKDNCHGCIDSLVETLPAMSDYAQDGTVFPSDDPITLIKPSGERVNTTTGSEFYRTHYNSKLIGKQNEDKSWNLIDEIYRGSDLSEVVISSKIIPNTLGDYSNQFSKQNPQDKFFANKQAAHNKEFYSAPLWAQQAVGGYNDKRKANDKKSDEEEYNQQRNDFIAEKLLKRTPFEGMDNRINWMNKFTPQELETIKKSKYSSELEEGALQKFENFILGMNTSGIKFKSKGTTAEEAEADQANPLNILQPLSIPTKAVQSAYKKNYSFSDAMKGKANNASIVEDIITDPLNLVGAGLVGKLSNKAGSKVLNKLDDAVNNINRIKFDDFKNDNEFFRVIVGDEAFDDIVQTQKIRTKQPSSVKNTPPNTINLDRRGSTAFPSFSKGSPSLSYANDNPNHYIIRTADESIKPSTSGRHGKGTTMFPTDKSGKHLTELDASKVQVYKHVGNGEYELVNTAKPIISSVDDVVKNLPKLEKVPLDFNIEDVLKNISSTERKNMEIIKKGNAYFKELNNPESLKRLKEFGDEYNIDLLDAYKKAENRWDYGKNIGEHSKFKVKKTDEDWYGLSTTDMDYMDELRVFDLENRFGKGSKQVKDFYKELSQKKSINYISNVVPLDRYEKTIWHELSHDINKSIIDQSPKLQKDIKNIFIEKGTADINKVKKGREYVAEDLYTKKDKILKDLDNPENLQKIGEKEFDYVTRPTETWAFLSTNLRQDLKNTGIIKNYNELLTPKKLEQAIKNGNTVFSRFEPYIKDKEAFIKLFNKMTLSIAPAALYLQSQNQNKTEQ